MYILFFFNERMHAIIREKNMLKVLVFDSCKRLCFDFTLRSYFTLHHFSNARNSESNDKNLNNKTFYFIREKTFFLLFYAMCASFARGCVIRMSNIVQVTVKPCDFPLSQKNLRLCCFHFSDVKRRY